MMLAVGVWQNPCATKAVPFQHISHDKASIIMLESRRVVTVHGDTFTYNLGTESIDITVDNFTAHLFLENVLAGRCSATQTVRLIPLMHTTFNSHFKTANAH